MNHTFSGAVLLSIIVLCTLALFAVAYFMKPKAEQLKTMSSKKSLKKTMSLKTTALKQSKPKFNSKSKDFSDSRRPVMAKLSKLKKLIGLHFPEFTATCSKNHIILERASKKVALLTLDKAALIGRRRLGEIVVINFHHLPSIEELKIELSGI